MFGGISRKIYKKIKKYDRIVIARHVGADPDALASTIALRDIILNTFPKKKVYAIGYPASKFKYLGILDKFTEDLYQNSLLIALDVPDAKRVDGVDPRLFQDSIKIDHHPFVEQYCHLEWVDDTASSTSQMIMELVLKTPLIMTKEAAEKLYLGLIADTDRFLFHYTTPKTFELVSKLIRLTNIDFTNLYEPLYLRPLKEVLFQGYIASHFTITENGVAYLYLDDSVLNDYGIDVTTARNMVANFNHIEEILVWALFADDKNRELIKGSIRSRGPIINECASHFQGGGHIFASGVRLKDDSELDSLIMELDQICAHYKEEEIV